jgi:hypothetical protein
MWCGGDLSAVPASIMLPASSIKVPTRPRLFAPSPTGLRSDATICYAWAGMIDCEACQCSTIKRSRRDAKQQCISSSVCVSRCVCVCVCVCVFCNSDQH